MIRRLFGILLAVGAALSPLPAGADTPARDAETRPPAREADKRKPVYSFRILTVGPMPRILRLPGQDPSSKIEYIPNGVHPSDPIVIPAEKLPGGLIEIKASRETFVKGVPVLDETPFAQFTLRPNKPELICLTRVKKGAALRLLRFDIAPDKPPACIVLNLTDRELLAVMNPTDKPRVIAPEKTLELPPAPPADSGSHHLRLALAGDAGFIRLNLGRLPLKPGGRSMVIVLPADPASNGDVPADINAFNLD